MTQIAGTGTNPLSEAIILEDKTAMGVFISEGDIPRGLIIAHDPELTTVDGKEKIRISGGLSEADITLFRIHKAEIIALLKAGAQ